MVTIRRQTLFVLVLFFLFGSFAPSVAADQAPPLLTLLSTEPVAEPSSPLSIVERPIAIAFDELIAETGSSLSLDLPDGQRYVAVRDSLEVRAPENWTWRGTLELGGQIQGRATLTYVDGSLSGLLYTETGMFHIVPRADGHVLGEIDSDRAPSCADSPHPEDLLPNVIRQPDSMPTVALPRAGSIEGGAGEGNGVLQPKGIATIDVLGLYTPAARSGAGGASQIRAVLQSALDLMNDALDNSNAQARVRFVGMEELNYAQSSTNMANDLQFITFDRGVADLREQTRADLVALIVNSSTAGTAGIAWLQQRGFAGLNFSAFGFSVTGRPFAVGNLTFAHELGHNLGCNHDPANGVPQNQALFPYSFGHLDQFDFQTVMATSNCGGCPRIPNYSNPNVTFRSIATGIPDQRENYRTIQQSAPTAGRFGTLRGKLTFDVGSAALDEDGGSVTLSVSRVDGTIGPISVNYSTANGTAVAGEDFRSTSGTLQWDNGEVFVTRQITIPIIDDNLLEDDETFTVRLSNPGGGAGLGNRATVTITIRNDDEQSIPDELRFSSTAVSTDEGSIVEIFVGRVGAGNGPASVVYSISSGSATAGSDFTPETGVLSWIDGDTGPRSFALRPIDDALVEGPETILLTLSDATGNVEFGNRYALLTVVDNDAAGAGGSVQFTSNRFVTSEPFLGAAFDVVRSSGSTGELTVNYSIIPGTAESADGDFASGSIVLADGETSGFIAVPVVDDNLVEGDETFTVRLDSVVGGSLGSRVEAVGLIRNDDGPGNLLSRDEVQCDEARLAGLLARMRAAAPGGGKMTSLNLGLTATGDFAGVAITGNGPETPEAHLAFSTNPEETTLLRNPTRLQLSSVNLTRNQVSSDLVIGGPDALEISLNPTNNLTSPAANELLVIDNREGATGADTSAKPGRGLDGLLDACQAKLTARDVHVIRVLSKIVRGEANDASGTEVAIYRGQGLNTYYLDVFPVDSDGNSTGRLALEFDITDVRTDGALLGAIVRALPACPPGPNGRCSDLSSLTGFQLAPPTFDEIWSETGDRLVVDPSGEGATQVEIDLGALLAGSSWSLPSAADPTLEVATALAPSEVSCDQERLSGLLDRTRLGAVGGGAPAAGSGLNLGLTATGDFAGLAYSANGPTPEAHLVFSTNPEETTLLRNPARPQLSSISLARNALSSDLLAGMSNDGVVVEINPTLNLVDPQPAELLLVDNRSEVDGLASSAKPGRGLSDLVTTCHPALSARDAHVIRVLTKIVRASSPGSNHAEIAIFRAATPDTFQIDVIARDAQEAVVGGLSAELSVTFTPAGFLEAGQLTVIPGPPNVSPPANSVVAVELIAPAFSDEVWTSAGNAVTNEPGGPTMSMIDFAALLGATTWRRPL